MRSTSTFEAGDGSHEASSLEETESARAATNIQSSSREIDGSDEFQNRKRKFLDDLTKAEKFKAKGNADLMRGKILVGHTAGNDLLASACKMYAQAVALVPLDVPVDLYGAECEKRKKMLHVSVLSGPAHSLARNFVGKDLFEDSWDFEYSPSESQPSRSGI